MKGLNLKLDYYAGIGFTRIKNHCKEFLSNILSHQTPIPNFKVILYFLNQFSNINIFLLIIMKSCQKMNLRISIYFVFGLYIKKGNIIYSLHNCGVLWLLEHIGNTSSLVIIHKYHQQYCHLFIYIIISSIWNKFIHFLRLYNVCNMFVPYIIM